MNRADRQAWTAALSKKVLDVATAAGLHPRPGLPPRLPKYRNRVVVVDGVRFASELEAHRYRELKCLRAAGEVAWFLKQVCFPLPGGVVFRADFLVVWKDGRIEIDEPKGMLTQASANKIAQVREIYGVKVNILRRADVSR